MCIATDLTLKDFDSLSNLKQLPIFFSLKFAEQKVKTLDT